MDKKYILITTVLNEEKLLPELIENVRNQTVTPELWLLVDNGSDDNTWSIIKKAVEEEDWIESKKDVTGEGYGFKRLNRARKKAVDTALELEDDSKYFGIADADAGLPEQYYEKLIDEMEKNKNLGVVAGLTYENGKPVILDYPREAAILYRKKALKEIGGYATHTGTVYKCREAGWEDETIKSIHVIHKRPVGSRKKSYIENGRFKYYLGVHPLYSLMISVRLFFSKNPIRGLKYFYGYFSSIGEKQIEDQELLWVNHKRFYNFWRDIFNNLKFW